MMGTASERHGNPDGARSAPRRAMRPACSIAALPGLWLAALCTLALALASSFPLAALATGGGIGPSMEASPGTEPLNLGEVWATAVALEGEAFQEGGMEAADASDRLSRAARLFERVGDAEGGRTNGYWRAARATWLVGELRPLGDTDAKLIDFHSALELADRGLAGNPDCAECMLWKFIAMGRLRTTTGAFEGMRQVREMADLLDRAIELNPTHRDGENNSTLGNLHYSSAIFYRIVPEWFWIRWVLGVKGDKERALRHSRKALELHPNRLDYQIEVATQLVCIGTARSDDERLGQGLTGLAMAVQRQGETEDDMREIHFAKLMIEQPEKACGYSGDALLEMDEDEARNAK